MPTDALLDLIIRTVRREATDVVSLELTHPDGQPLPEWQPGAHVDLHLPSGIVRSYSLHGDPADMRTYRIAVLRAAAGRGGSAEVHRIARPGSRVAVGHPRNNFTLEPAGHYLFLAGGIGVTPLLAMVRNVAAAGLPWTFVYGGRSRPGMAFVAEIGSLPGGDVQVVPQDEAGLPDLAAAFREVPAGTAVYCCGPASMIAAVVSTGQAIRPDIPVRLEYFSAAIRDHARADDTAFDVVLANTQLTVHVPAGTSILDAIRPSCPNVMSSCEEGICSSCETEVLEGVPDHRDSVLTPAERETNQYMMICVSRSRTACLVLDL
jgi:tetrachlorobenzoquinone reductase